MFNKLLSACTAKQQIFTIFSRQSSPLAFHYDPLKSTSHAENYRSIKTTDILILNISFLKYIKFNVYTVNTLQLFRHNSILKLKLRLIKTKSLCINKVR